MREISSTKGLTRNIQEEAQQASNRRAASRGDQNISTAVALSTGENLNTRAQGDTTAESFEKQLNLLFGESKTEYNEREMYVGAVRQRLDSPEFFGDGRKVRFLQHYNDILGDKGPERIVYAASHALKRMVQAGQLDVEEARQIRREAFGSAQQDSDTNRLTGGTDSSSTFERSTAISTSAATLESYDNDEDAPMGRRQRRTLKAQDRLIDDGQ